MQEKQIESYLTKEVKKAGGLALKFVSPSFAGVPDRLLLFPDGKLSFAEVKRPGEKPRELQWARIKQLRRLGFKVWVVDSKEKVREVINDAVHST